MAEIQSIPLLVVITSFSRREDAQVMARQLLEQRLAACVQIMEGVLSVYRWQGRICEEQEVILTAKSDATQWKEIAAFIKTNHPYDVPEVIGMTPSEYDRAYGQWVRAEVKPES